MGEATSVDDLEGMSVDELSALSVEVMQERNRRATLADLPGRVAALATEWQDAAGVGDGDEWAPPTGLHDTVPPGGVRTFAGVLHENTSGLWLAVSPEQFPAGWTALADGATTEQTGA